MSKGEGKRFNLGKTRHDLVPTFAQEQYAKVLTMGAEKYGDHNWQKGMDWSKVIASMVRHIEAIKRGEDFDPESGLLHSAHVMCNAAFLSEYYKIYPEGDDRVPGQFYEPKIGLDIDGVLAAFSEDYLDYFNLDRTPARHWNDIRFRDEERWKDVQSDKYFWTGMTPLITGKDLPFEPHCYITARSIPKEWTQEWLDTHGFPRAPLYSVGRGVSKVDTVKESGIEYFVDDSYTNYVELNQNGIFTYLMTRSHNEKYNVGHRRINSLKEILDK